MALCSCTRYITLFGFCPSFGLHSTVANCFGVSGDMGCSPLAGTLVACDLCSYSGLLVLLLESYVLSTFMTPLSLGNLADLIARLFSCFLIIQLFASVLSSVGSQIVGTRSATSPYLSGRDVPPYVQLSWNTLGFDLGFSCFMLP